MRNRYPHRPLALLAVCFALLAVMQSGCGRSGVERVLVSGTVTYRGKPLEAGEIRFYPAKGTKAPMSGAVISNGKYTVDNKGGVPVGTHKIQIVAKRPKSGARRPAGDGVLDENMFAPLEQYLPVKYNTQTQLELTIEPGSGPITSDFELTDGPG